MIVKPQIANTGLLPSGITLGDLKKTHTSHPRNPNITKVFYRRGLIEAMGMGTQQIIKACVNANMKEPKFFEQAGTFIVRLWSRNYEHATSSHMKSNLTERQEKILATLDNKELAPNEILAALGEDISDRTLRRDLQTLREKGYLDNKGQLGPKTKWFKRKTRTTRT